MPVYEPFSHREWSVWWVVQSGLPDVFGTASAPASGFMGQCMTQNISSGFNTLPWFERGTLKGFKKGNDNPVKLGLSFNNTGFWLSGVPTGQSGHTLDIVTLEMKMNQSAISNNRWVQVLGVPINDLSVAVQDNQLDKVTVNLQGVTILGPTASGYVIP